MNNKFNHLTLQLQFLQFRKIYGHLFWLFQRALETLKASILKSGL